MLRSPLRFHRSGRNAIANAQTRADSRCSPTTSCATAGGDTGRARGSADRGVLRRGRGVGPVPRVCIARRLPVTSPRRGHVARGPRRARVEEEPVGQQFSFEGDNIVAMVFRTCRQPEWTITTMLPASPRNTFVSWASAPCRSADHCRRPAVGRGRWSASRDPSRCRRCRGARRRLRGSGCDGHRECASPRRAHRVPGPHRRGRRRRAAPYRTRSA